MNFSSLPITGLHAGLLFGLAGLVFGLSFGLYGMYLQHRRRVLWHETARIALEKGQPIPEPSPDQPPWQWQTPQAGSSASTANSVSSALKSHYSGQQRRGWMIGGLINVGVGIGLFVALSQVSKPTAYFAAIPFFIGVALLLGFVIESLFSQKSGQ